MDTDALIQDLFFNEQYNNLNSLLERVNSIYQESLQPTENVTCDFVDKQFLSEIKALSLRGDVKLLFGKTLRDLKCLIRDAEDREHWLLLRYNDKTKLRIISTSLPHSAFQDRDYTTVEEVLNSFKCHVDSLLSYFMELEKIDRFCSVVDPVKPSFKDDYRKIVLADRVWLHIEVTPEGAAADMHLVGRSHGHSTRLQDGLRAWDHDRDIVDNVMDIFDIVNFPQPQSQPQPQPATAQAASLAAHCGICLSDSCRDVPQPLCPHARCGAYFHRDCLFAWLVASAGGRVPSLGVAAGSCPACFEPVTCAQSDH